MKIFKLLLKGIRIYLECNLLMGTLAAAGVACRVYWQLDEDKRPKDVPTWTVKWELENIKYLLKELGLL